MQEEKILADLKEGDEVAIQTGMSESYHVYRITKIGSKGIIEISTGARYRPDGTPIEKGSKWHRPDPIEPVTDAIRQTIRKSRLIGKLSALDYNQWKAMDLETLEAVAMLIWKQGK